MLFKSLSTCTENASTISRSGAVGDILKLKTEVFSDLDMQFYEAEGFSDFIQKFAGQLFKGLGFPSPKLLQSLSAEMKIEFFELVR